MTLTRQHFQMIAEIVAESPDRDRLATIAADRLAETNPRFDRARFLTAATTVPPSTIVRVERLKSSVNGNPRFRLHFADGSSAPTAPDAGFAYGISSSLEGRAVVPTLNGRGWITRLQTIIPGA